MASHAGFDPAHAGLHLHHHLDASHFPFVLNRIVGKWLIVKEEASWCLSLISAMP
jgi:hypothetical protein